jgi:uncharacterized protein involved in exopolysaccharide biosynthesis
MHVPEEPGLELWVEIGLRRWRFLVITALATGVLALGIGFLIPKTYVARASVLPPHEATILDALLAGRMLVETGLPYSAGITLLDVYTGILDSDTVARTVMRRFDLQNHYAISTESRTLKKLKSATDVKPTQQGILEISVEDKDPRLAADLANAYVEELDRVYRKTVSGTSRRQRKFLEGRLEESRAHLDSLEAALAELQAGRGITALGRDATEAAIAAGDLMGRRLALSVQIEMMRELGVGSSPMRDELEAELRATEVEAAKLPQLGMELARQLRDHRIEERLHEALAQQLETARLEEARDTPVVEVLDVAVPPDRHARPRKGILAAVATVIGFGLSFARVVYEEKGR